MSIENENDTPYEMIPISWPYFEGAEVGDVTMVPESQVLPPGWYPCEGERLRSEDWPEFRDKLGVVADTFVVPKPNQVLPNHRFIVKLGERAGE